MKIVNLTKTRIEVQIDNPAHFGPVTNFSLDDGQEWNKDVGYAACSLSVRTFNGYRLYDDVMKDWPNNSTMIATVKDDHRVIDYNVIRNDWENKSRGLLPEQREQANAKTDQCAGFIFHALFSALGALGPIGALASFKGALFEALAFDRSAPPAPDIAQIERVVRSVVSSELDKNNARQGATVFNLVAHQYWEVCSNAGFEKFADLNPHAEHDKEKLATLLEFVDQYSSYHDSPGFIYFIEIFRNNPNIAKYKCAEFFWPYQ